MQSLERLWISEQKAGTKLPLNTIQVPNMHQAMETTTNYLIYIFSKKISDSHNAVMSNQCRLQNRIRFDTLEHFEGNFFIRDIGDSLVLTKCKLVIATLRTNSEYCY